MQGKCDIIAFADGSVDERQRCENHTGHVAVWIYHERQVGSDCTEGEGVPVSE